MVPINDDICLRYPIGIRVKIGVNSGTVRYIGEICGYKGTWLGIEWDDPSRGKHNGVVNGKHYFYTAHPTAGSFIRPDKLGPFESLETAARERYLVDSEKSLDQQLIREAQELLQASLFQVVGLEKLARKQSKFEHLTEISVAGSPVNSAGYLMEFTALTTLNLSHTLIWNWQIIAETCRQVSTLKNLNLSCNRFVAPSDSQTVELSSAFDNLQLLNLRNCEFRDWHEIIQTARLWPQIMSVGLQENPISEISISISTKDVFKNLRELDLHRTKITDFDHICKLGYLETLVSLNLTENGIKEVKLPDCEPNTKLDMFISLEQLSLLYNPIRNETDTFNELDKLPQLKRLNKTPHLKSNFGKMLVKAVGLISGLEMVNRAEISADERRGAEYDIWKKYALDWLQASKFPETLKEFYKKHRSYALLIRKYDSPIDFVPRANTKISKLIKIRILNEKTGEMWEKKFPRMISVQTLLGLLIKHFHLDCLTMTPELYYSDSRNPDLVVPLDNLSKTLDFYSLQENDIVQVTY
uniref:Tubulin-specific chaperone E n=1 Tax=Glossina palpalis gambiensis TaxID=67801 RepID=A0A1B0AXA3_9MUSC